MNPLRGTSVYCGMDVDIETIIKHLDDAQKAGINAIFTSLQLPEADVEITLRDFPIMTKEAHKRGMVVAADIAQRTATRFGIDLKDFKTLKKFGVDIMRLDAGYTDEEIVEVTHNTDGICVMMNADGTEEMLRNFTELGVNKEQTLFCHNYYPMKYTGKKRAQAKAINDLLHKYGFRVSGFLASQTHQRMACSRGLPTVEAHRYLDAFPAAQEMQLLGFDDIFFGDDLASLEEMQTMVEALSGPVTFRMKALLDDPVIDWLDGHELEQIGNNLDEIVRSSFCDKNSLYPGNPNVGLPGAPKKGDVLLCKDTLYRYTGEIQIARMDIPEDPDIGIIGHIIDSDISLLENFKTDDNWGPNFRFKVIK